MRAVVLDLDGSPVEEVELPPVFTAPFRPDVIHKVFTIWQSRSKQPQGRDPMAGKRMSAESWGVGHGVARIARYKA
ncbi:TPA: 50S ribosomal protein L4, partial [Candidatus Micrarchaeota archaeon]|nr:50S ribosomal protein L4 [Candidatus Micrarchaeota archaeon]